MAKTQVAVQTITEEQVELPFYITGKKQSKTKLLRTKNLNRLRELTRSWSKFTMRYNPDFCDFQIYLLVLISYLDQTVYQPPIPLPVVSTTEVEEPPPSFSEEEIARVKEWLRTSVIKLALPEPIPIKSPTTSAVKSHWREILTLINGGFASIISSFEAEQKLRELIATVNISVLLSPRLLKSLPSAMTSWNN